jgi:hypothetical protein
MWAFIKSTYINQPSKSLVAERMLVTSTVKLKATEFLTLKLGNTEFKLFYV